MEQQLINRAWYESPGNRLSIWRDFRRELDTSNVIDVCRTVVKWWESAPLSKISIDPVDSTCWPTAWEMLHHGDFCEHSVALGMAYTIYYANPDIPNELVFLTCNAQGIQKLCALIDNKHLLNFDHGKISIFPCNDCSISYQIKLKDLIN